MDLTTRCPNCGTVFQASLSDLQLRKGYIRCVQCAHIFDGYAEVVQDPSQPEPPGRGADPTEPVPAAAPDEPWPEPPPQVIRAGRPVFHADTSSRSPEFRVGVAAPWPEDGPRTDSRWNEPHVGEDADAPPDEPEPAWGRGRDDEPEPTWNRGPPVNTGAIVVEPHPSYRGGGSAAPLLRPDTYNGTWASITRFFSVLLLVLLVLVFVAQLVYVYRGRVAQFAPSARPWLEQACVSLHCRVPYARDIGKIVITGSALKVDDAAPSTAAPASGPAGASASQGAPGTEQHFVLQVTMRNQLGQAQEWPTLVLDLKDGSGTLLLRRNLSPAEYLGPTMAGQPFAARSDALLRVPLTLSGVRINGYQLDLFFP